MDLLYFFPSIHEATARSCALVCLSALYPLQLALRVVDTLSARRGPQGDLSTLASFLVTVLMGRVNQMQLSVDAARHEALVQSVCRAVSRIDSPGEQGLCTVSSSCALSQVQPLCVVETVRLFVQLSCSGAQIVCCAKGGTFGASRKLTIV